MKLKLLIFLLGFSYWVNAQTITNWLQLSPQELDIPVLSEVKDVNNKTFSNNLLLSNYGIEITNLKPEISKKEELYPFLTWTKAENNGDTIVLKPESSKFQLAYFATYLENDIWVKGKLKLRLLGRAEVYVDGVKKLTYAESQPVDRNFDCELTPGKHLVIIKTISTGGNCFVANFEVTEPKTVENISFTLSPKRGKTIYDTQNGTKAGGVSVSPSGKYAIVTTREVFTGKATSNTHIYNIKNKEIVYTPTGMSVRWMPDKDCISYLRREGNGNSLYIFDIEKGEQKRLIKEDRDIQNYTWSPDLKYIIYSKNESFTDDKWQLRKLAGIEDRQPYYRNRSKLYKYDFATGLHSQLTWGNLTTSLMDIHPDGDKLIFSTSTPDYEEYPYRKQAIYMMDLNSHKLDTLWKDQLFSISCSFSPDGKKLLVRGGPSAFGKMGENIGKNKIANQYDTQLYIFDLATKEVEAITKDFTPSINSAVWHENGNIYINAVDKDYNHFFIYNPSEKTFTQVQCPGDVIQQMSIAKKGNNMMYVANGEQSPPVVYAMDLGILQAEVWSTPSAKDYENIVFGEIKEWDYNYKKGTLIDGRYYLPADFDPSKKYPLLVYYYGGTTPVSRSFGGRYPFNLYAANGYIVYVMQPSGAIGYGQEFSARHQNNWGKITGDEIISSVKAFIKEHDFIDGTKVGCMGASYGGFTTMYLTTQTDLFTCAISHAGISSISGYWGDGYWGYSYSTNAAAHSFPWNRKDIYVDQSPLFNADKVNTPILLLHGTKDTNVPTSQSMEFYTALKLLGKEAEFVMIKDADHHVVEYEQVILWHNTILAWFEKYLKEEPAWWENIYKDKNL